MIRVLVADDHDFVRAGLVELLDSTGDMTVVAECQDGDEVVTAALQTAPDVVLLDLRMPRLPGLEAARALRAVRPDARIVVLTGSPSRSTAGEARELGAVGYLLKAARRTSWWTSCARLRRVVRPGTDRFYRAKWPDSGYGTAWRC